jgi:hypothetical protein
MRKLLALLMILSMYGCVYENSKDKELQEKWDKVYKDLMVECSKAVQEAFPERSQEDVVVFCKCANDGAVETMRKYILDPDLILYINPDLINSFIARSSQSCADKSSK